MEGHLTLRRGDDVVGDARLRTRGALRSSCGSVSHQRGGVDFFEHVERFLWKVRDPEGLRAQQPLLPLTRVKDSVIDDATFFRRHERFPNCRGVDGVDVRGEHVANPHPFNVEWRDEFGPFSSWDTSKQRNPYVLVPVDRALQDLFVEVQLRMVVHGIQG